MKKIFLNTVCILTISTLLAGCSFGGSSDTANVTVSKVKTAGSISDTVYSGNVVSAEEVSIIPSVSGKVQTIDVEVGQTVEKGDTLFTIDNTDLTYKLNQAQANYDAAEATYEKTSGGTSKQAQIDANQALEKAKNELNDATNAYNTAKSQSENNTLVTSAQVAYDSAKSNYDRNYSLYEGGAIAKVTLEDAKNKLDSAEAQLEIAKANQDTALKNAESRLNNAQTSVNSASENYNITNEINNPDNTKAAKAQMDSAKAALDLAQHQLDNSVVTAPIAGKISSKSIDVGGMTPAQGASMVLTNVDSINVDIKVTETNINEISVGMSAKINVPATGLSYDGTISTISPSADEKTGMFDVKIAVESSDENIKVGMVTDVTLAGDNENDTLLVPQESIFKDGDNSYVYLIEGDKLSKHLVTLGQAKNQYFEISDGLTKDDQIVVDGSSNMKDGIKFNIVKSN